jgi:hypothetical protein
MLLVCSGVWSLLHAKASKRSAALRAFQSSFCVLLLLLTVAQLR